MPSEQERVRIVRRTLADGTVKEYRYRRQSGASRSRFAAESVAALILAYRGSPEWEAKRPATQTNYRIYLRDLEELAHMPIAKVRRRGLMGLRDVIATERGHGAANVFVHVASVLFSWAVKREWIEHSPALGIEALPGGEIVAWTPAQADRAIAELPEAYRRVVVLARYTGQRRGDLCALRWSAYDGHRIRLKQQKTGTELVLTCPSVLRAELDQWRRTATSLHILTTPRGLPWRPMLLTQALPPRLVKIGLPPLPVHGLRKLCATELAHAGCTAHEIAAVTGHKTLAMVQHYTKSADQERLGAGATRRLENAQENVRKNAMQLIEKT